MPTNEILLSSQEQAMRILDDERVRRGMNVRDLEAKSGVSVSSFYAWKANIRSPHLFNLTCLAESLGFQVVLRKRK